jgi:hypothetical protein
MQQLGGMIPIQTLIAARLWMEGKPCINSAQNFYTVDID